MHWQQVLADPTLQDLPYKIETNEWGQIVMTPATNELSLVQTLIAGFLMERRSRGIVLTECSIDTLRGVKVADVVWASADFHATHGTETPYPVAPEICVEVISTSNTKREMQEKIALYLAKGAHEVWICDAKRRMHSYDHSGEKTQSTIFPAFPGKIEL